MLEELYSAAKGDQAYQKVLGEVRKGLTKEALKLLPPDHRARALSQQWDEIGVMERKEEGLLIFQGTRLIVPKAARKKIKEFLHLPHLGQQLTYQAAALRYFWPGGMKEEIFKLVESCRTCAIHSSSRQREVEAQERYQPRQPMDLIVTDLFEVKGSHYIIVLDVFSGYPWVRKFGKAPRTDQVTGVLNEIFLTWGYPRHIKADGGGQYRAEFKQFCAQMYITPHTTSAYNHESNGEAEVGVAKVKALIKKVAHSKGDFDLAFSRLRDAPTRHSKLSPARLMFRRILRFPGLPSLPDDVDEVAAGQVKQARKVSAKEERNAKVSRFGRKVVELEEGLHVLLQDDRTKLFDIEAVVVRVCEGGRSAYVQAEDRGGRTTTFLRNRRFMIKDPAHNVEVAAEAELAMVTKIIEDKGMPIKQLSGKAREALLRTKASSTGILKSTPSLLSSPTVEVSTRRKAGALHSVPTQ